MAAPKRKKADRADAVAEKQRRIQTEQDRRDQAERERSKLKPDTAKAMRSRCCSRAKAPMSRSST